jgi:hypothetical protein
LLAPEEVYDGEAEAEFMARCLNRLANRVAADDLAPALAACSWPVDHDAFFSAAED